ncbi:MAG TPA: PEP-CTERM sorting domain-containing protein [Geobacteraceae bacterium]|nr:PEP-CTERM sorting domain-containing protein [Geobacteraceae bacterium]
MKRFILVMSCVATAILTNIAHGAPITLNSTAGDKDFAATRSTYDNASNMDWYVFTTGSGLSGTATNSTGTIAWNYVLPNEIVTAYSGSMTIRAWDIDPSDIMNVYFNLESGDRVYAGLLTGSNGGNITTWENAVANGTTASLGGWSTTTFTLGSQTLAAISGTSGFSLELDVRNEAYNWAAVIDYADLTLNYEPGAPNPNSSVPEPSSFLLLGAGIAGLGLLRKKFRK